MAWTYDVTELATSAIAQVRLTIGDTDPNDPLMQDEEIQFVLGQAAGDVMSASVLCCDFLVRRFGKMASYSLGAYSVNYSKRAEVFRQLAADFRKQKALSGPPIMATPRESIFDVGMMDSTTCTAVNEEE